MNEDPFEKKLASLAHAMKSPDPTPGWKTDILGRARREAAGASATSPRTAPPRWLLAAWGVAWALVLLMHFTAPASASSPRDHAAILQAPLPSQSLLDANETQAVPLTLVAFHREMNAQNDLP